MKLKELRDNLDEIDDLDLDLNGDGVEIKFSGKPVRLDFAPETDTDGSIYFNLIIDNTQDTEWDGK